MTVTAAAPPARSAARPRCTPGAWEATIGGNARRLYAFGGAVVAQRDGNGTLTYLHGDHLGSVSVLTDAAANLAPNGKQEFDSWGKVRAGGITSTTLLRYL